MARNFNKKEEKEPLLRAPTASQRSNNYPAADNHNGGVLNTEIECDAECDDDAETIRRTADVGGEAFPSRRLSSSASNCDLSFYYSVSETSASNTSEGHEMSSTASITGGQSKWRFWSTIITFTISSLLGGLAVSIIVPFYTTEAEEKGITVTQAGLVFGSVNLVQIVFIPIFGKYLRKLGAHNLFLSGVFVAGISNVAFGFLQWADNKDTFLALSFVIRIISAIGEAAFLTALYPLATMAVSERYRSTILSVMETSFGVGMTCGPAVGGVLYDFKGFYFPFVCVGGILVICSIICAFVLDKKSSTDGEHEESIRSTSECPEDGRDSSTPIIDTTYRKLFGLSAITIPFIILVLSEMSIAWFLPTLEPFLSENFNLDSTMSGFLFSLEGLTYAGFSPLWGILLDRGVSPYLAMTFGVVTQMVGLSMLGPARYFEFIPKSPYTTGIGLFILGSGIAASFIVTLTFMMNEAPKADKNISDTEQTRGMITSLWLIAENIGGWSGSFLGSVAYDNLGFEGGSLVIIGMQFIIVAAIPYVWYRTVQNKRKMLYRELSNNNESDFEQRKTDQMGNKTTSSVKITSSVMADEKTPLLNGK